MRKSEKREKIIAILDELFPKPDVPLDHTDPFSLLIAVLLSAQCTDERVNTVTPALFKKANTPKKWLNLVGSKFIKSSNHVD